MTRALAYGPRSLWIRDFVLIGAGTSLLAPFFAVQGMEFLSGHHLAVPASYFVLAVLAGALSGAGVGAALHFGLQKLRPLWLLPAVPLVACEVISPELVAYARSKQVRIWCNGTVLDAAA